MQALPHTYQVSASGVVSGALDLAANGVPHLKSDSPKEFDGPGDQWSPESLLAAAVASCFILTFRAVARASKLEWKALECAVDGTLERSEGVTQFTKFVTRATLSVGPGVNADLCRRALEKAEHGCLVANSLKGTRELTIELKQE